MAKKKKVIEFFFFLLTLQGVLSTVRHSCHYLAQGVPYRFGLTFFFSPLSFSQIIIISCYDICHTRIGRSMANKNKTKKTKPKQAHAFVGLVFILLFSLTLHTTMREYSCHNVSYFLRHAAAFGFDFLFFFFSLFKLH